MADGFSGKHIAAKIGDVTPVLVPGVQSWAGNSSVVKLDGQTAEDQGYTHPGAGSKTLAVNMDLVIDITAGDLVALDSGTTIQNLKLYAHVDSPTPIFHCPEFLVLTATPRGEINGRFTYSVTGENVGPFTFSDPNATA